MYFRNALISLNMASVKEIGLELSNIRLSDVRKKGKKDFASNRDPKRTKDLPDPGEICCICCVEEGYEMKCNHYICPNCLLDLAWLEIENQKYAICCGNCKTKIDIDDVIHFGIPDGTEKQFITSALSLNLINKEDVQQCPSCLSYCERIDPEDIQVNCAYCTNELSKPYLFCWNCLGEWNNKENNIQCGNKDCGNIIDKILNESPKITFEGSRKIIETPSVRACPNCYSLVEHIELCNEMTCTSCEHIFCFICLSPKENDALICNTESWDGAIRCTPAPIQDKFKSVLKI